MGPRLLDLFCGAGGAAMGYHRAGFAVTGVDNRPQPGYPFRCVTADALEYAVAHAGEYDAIHASPPCQRYSRVTRYHPGRADCHADLLQPTRRLLEDSGRPWVIENVQESFLPFSIVLCGLMFGLRVYRHRRFACSFLAWSPHHPPHRRKAVASGRRGSDEDVYTATGHFCKATVIRAAMGIDWPMPRDGIAQAVPPAYTVLLGMQLLSVIRTE